MKKLMIAAAIAFTAVAVNAAAIGWNCAGATDFKGGNYGLFLIGQNGVESVKQITDLAKAGKSVSDYVWANGTVANNGAASAAATTSGKSITYDPAGGEAGNTYTGFIVVWTPETADAKSYTSWTDSKSITLVNDSTAKQFAFGSQAAAFAANKSEIGDVPEPTSALLMLLGVAGLALKRKQK